MKTEFVLLKTPQGIINFAIRKENGEVFSFSADDSAGAFKDRYVRTYLLIDKESGCKSGVVLREVVRVHEDRGEVTNGLHPTSTY